MSGSNLTIVKQQYAISLGEIGDEFELATRDGKTILLDDIDVAGDAAQWAADHYKRPTRVLKVSEVSFKRPGAGHVLPVKSESTEAGN